MAHTVWRASEVACLIYCSLRTGDSFSGKERELPCRRHSLFMGNVSLPYLSFFSCRQACAPICSNNRTRSDEVWIYSTIWFGSRNCHFALCVHSQILLLNFPQSLIRLIVVLIIIGLLPSSSLFFFRFVALFFIPSSLVYWTHTNSNACGNLVIDFELVYFTFCGVQCLNLSVDQFGGQEQRKRTVDY